MMDVKIIENHLLGNMEDGTYVAPHSTFTAHEIRQKLWELHDAEAGVDLKGHVEAVAYADDMAEGGDPVPEDYERHYCEEDGEDWPCATVRALGERIPGEPFTLEELARQHEKIGETWSLMAQTVPAFHALTAKALRWAASRAFGPPSDVQVNAAVREYYGRGADEFTTEWMPRVLRAAWNAQAQGVSDGS